MICFARWRILVRRPIRLDIPGSQQFKGDHPQRPYVHCIRVASCRVPELWRHVQGRAREGVHISTAGESRTADIRDLGDSSSPTNLKKNILRFEVAVCEVRVMHISQP